MGKCVLKIDLGEFEIDEYTPDPTPNYILDVTKLSSYQNQTEEYYQSYGKWRSEKNNKFGYKFVKDIREHTYQDGKGFVSDSPDKAERKTLASCFNLIAVVLIISQLLNLLEHFIIARMNRFSIYSSVFFLDLSRIENVSFSEVLVSCVFRILKLAVPIAIFFFVTRFPKAVALPKAKNKDYELSLCGISFILLVTILSRTANNGLNMLTNIIGIDFSNNSFLHTYDTKSIVLFCIVEYFIFPILTEILFRGIILQFFRQFGDFFAILVSCITSVICCRDISQIMPVALYSVILALFTIRTGSITTAIFMQISANIVEMIVSRGVLIVSPDVQVIVEAYVGIAIISFALIAYSRNISKKIIDFNVDDSYTYLTLRDKFIIMISSGALIVWLVLALVVFVLSIKFEL